MKSLSKTPEMIRRCVPESKMARAMRWLLIFALGFYCARIWVETTGHAMTDCAQQSAE